MHDEKLGARNRERAKEKTLRGVEHGAGCREGEQQPCTPKGQSAEGCRRPRVDQVRSGHALAWKNDGGGDSEGGEHRQRALCRGSTRGDRERIRERIETDGPRACPQGNPKRRSGIPRLPGRIASSIVDRTIDEIGCATVGAVRLGLRQQASRPMGSLLEGKPMRSIPSIVWLSALLLGWAVPNVAMAGRTRTWLWQDGAAADGTGADGVAGRVYTDPFARGSWRRRMGLWCTHLSPRLSTARRCLSTGLGRVWALRLRRLRASGTTYAAPQAAGDLHRPIGTKLKRCPRYRDALPVASSRSPLMGVWVRHQQSQRLGIAVREER